MEQVTDIVSMDDALVKENVTEKVLEEIQKFKELEISGLDDKEGYEAVHKAQMFCRKLRTTTEKVCKAGREEAVAVQKRWIEKEKSIVVRIRDVEDLLAARKNKIDEEKKRIAEEAERLERERQEAELRAERERQEAERRAELEREQEALRAEREALEQQKRELAEAQRLVAEANAKAEQEAKVKEEKAKLRAEKKKVDAFAQEMAGILMWAAVVRDLVGEGKPEVSSELGVSMVENIRHGVTVALDNEVERFNRLLKEHGHGTT